MSSKKLNLLPYYVPSYLKKLNVTNLGPDIYRQPWAVAVHETGHFVAGYMAGLKGVKLTIEKSECHGENIGEFEWKPEPIDELLNGTMRGRKFKPRNGGSEEQLQGALRHRAQVRLMESVAGTTAVNVMFNTCSMPDGTDESEAKRLAEYLSPDDPWTVYDQVSSFVAGEFSGALRETIRLAAKELLRAKTLKGAEIDSLWQRVKPVGRS